jgi:flagellar biosynthesis/type III secretory pathway M-ring protein FliF/YscJ
MPFYVTAWNWLAKNSVAQGIAAAIAVVLAFLFWLAAFHDPRIRREATRKANDRAEKQSKTILKDMEEESNDRIEAAREARERVPDDVDRSQLSDGASSILFDAFKDRGGGGGY